MYQRFAPPRTPRALFELFALYMPGPGIDTLLDCLDFDGVEITSLHPALFGADGNVPAAQAGNPLAASPRDYLHQALHSQAFQAAALKLLLNAYHAKQRFLFVHIPKCAGTDLTTLLRQLYPSLRRGIFIPESSYAALFNEIRDFVNGVRYSKIVVMAGHERLAYLQEHMLIREQDRVFTTVRDPADLVYSYISYILTICRDAPRTRRPDGLAWLAALGLQAIPADATAASMADLGRRILYDQTINRANTLCHFLGDGSADNAFARLAQTNIEITDTVRYPAWRAASFPGAAATRENASTPYFTQALATAADRAHIADITAQDRKLYGAIQAALARGGALSVRGSAVRKQDVLF